MTIRFPTEAANADILGEDPDAPAGRPDPRATGADERHLRPRRRDSGERPSRGGDVRPGKDINAPGFLRDKDRDKP